MVLARESVFRLHYFSVLFSLLLLLLLVYCIALLEEYVYFLCIYIYIYIYIFIFIYYDSRLIPYLFLILVWGS